MKIAKLALSNIRKSKSAAVSLFILIFIAALLLNAGMTVIFKINTFYDDKVKELHDSHMSIIMNRADYKQPYSEYLKSYSGVIETEMENIILMGGAKFRYGDNELDSSAALLNADDTRMIAPLKLIEKLADSSNDIYLSNSFKSSGGYKLSDSFTMTYKDKQYNYRVAGFFESTMLGSNDAGLMKYYLPDAAYRELLSTLGETAEGVLLSAILTDSTKSSELFDDYSKQFPGLNQGLDSAFFWAVDIELVKSIGTMTLNIIAMILVAFAAVIVLVSLIVIKFRVTNSIDDGIVNIGILKAVGYTSKQILASTMLQFMLITLVAGFTGVALSYAAMPVFGGVISSLSGLTWVVGFDAVINMASILIVAALVLVVTWLSSLRIKRLHPVAALRGGITTHHFKRNLFPLTKARGGLHFALACKTIMKNSKQNLTILFIIIAITFASVFSIVLYYNVAADKTAFVHMVGAETSNVMVQAKTGEDGEKLLTGLAQMDDVEKLAILDFIQTRIEDQIVYTSVSDDFSKLENNTVYEGRSPEYDNEIALSWTVAKLLNKNIGDTVHVEAGDGSYSFLITGLSQSMGNMGMAAALTLSGVHHLLPEYKGILINVYLKGIDNASFIQSIKAQYGGLTDNIIDVDESINSGSGLYITAVFSVMVMVLMITTLVVILILYLVIKTMIVKRKREFGILKAIGYTTFQLMTQITLSFIPIVIAGVVIGGVLGCLYTNTMLTLLLSSSGIHNVQFIVHIPLIITLCIGLIVLSYVVSLTVARGIKRISAYGLITE